MRTPSSARPACPYGLVEGRGKAGAACAPTPGLARGAAALVLAGFLADFLTDFLAVVLADFLAAGFAGFRLAFLVAMVTPFTCVSPVYRCGRLIFCESCFAG